MRPIEKIDNIIVKIDSAIITQLTRTGINSERAATISFFVRNMATFAALIASLNIVTAGLW